MNAPLTALQNGSASYAISPNQLGLRLDADASVDKALPLRTDWIVMGGMGRGLFSGHDVPATSVSSGDLTNASLISLTPDVDKAPANASIDFSEAAASLFRTCPVSASTTRLPAPRWGGALPASLDCHHRDTADVTEATLNKTLPTAPKGGCRRHVDRGLSGMSWSLDQAQLKSLVSVSADGTTVVVNRDALKAVDGIASSVERHSKDAILLVRWFG